MLKPREYVAHELKLLDMVELRADTAEPRQSPWGGSVKAGSLGTIVEMLRDDVYLVEFKDASDGEPAILTVPAHLLSLHWSAP
jgi:hypothetical protein